MKCGQKDTDASTKVSFWIWDFAWAKPSSGTPSISRYIFPFLVQMLGSDSFVNGFFSEFLLKTSPNTIRVLPQQVPLQVSYLLSEVVWTTVWSKNFKDKKDGHFWNKTTQSRAVFVEPNEGDQLPCCWVACIFAVMHVMKGIDHQISRLGSEITQITWGEVIVNQTAKNSSPQRGQRETTTDRLSSFFFVCKMPQLLQSVLLCDPFISARIFQSVYDF